MDYKHMCDQLKHNQLSEIERFIALSSLANKPARQASDGIKRWLELDEIISFSGILRGNSHSNAELIINNNEYHTIWYSQLSQKLYYGEPDKFLTSKLILKNGKTLQLCYTSFPDFWNIVRNKRFKVTKVESGCKLNDKKPEIKKMMSFENAIKFIHNLAITKDPSFSSFTIYTKAYTITEI